MNITQVQNYCIDTFEKYKHEWPLAAKASVIGAIVYKTLGATATGMYIATALILYHKHEYIIKQISQINYSDIIFSIIACVSPFFGMYGICGNAILVVADVVKRNIQFYKISASQAKTQEKLDAIKAKNGELERTFTTMCQESELKYSDMKKRIEQVDKNEEECKTLLAEAKTTFSETCTMLDTYNLQFGSPDALRQKIEAAQAHIECIKTTLESNRRIWQVLLERGANG